MTLAPGPQRPLLLEFVESTLWAQAPVPQPLGETDWHVQAHPGISRWETSSLSEGSVTPHAHELGQGSEPEPQCQFWSGGPRCPELLGWSGS